MKATGIVRRIDDLGRIVIPKEIRKNLKINEGDSLEIYVNEEEVILKKYSFLENVEGIANKLLFAFSKTYKKCVMITDKEKIISSTNNIYINKSISNNIKNNISNRTETLGKKCIFSDDNISNNYYLIPIIIDSDAIGSIIMIDKEIDDSDISLIKLLSFILVKNIEE